MPRELYGLEWHYTLVHKEHEQRDSLLKSNDSKDRPPIVISYHKPHPYDEDRIQRLYTGLSTIEQLVFYHKQVPSAEWNFFEVIFGDRPQKLYFDLDIECDDHEPQGTGGKESDQSWEYYAQECLFYCLQGCVYVFDKLLNINLDTNKSVRLFQSHKPGEKYSYHLIIDHYLFQDAKTVKYLFNQVKETVPPKFHGKVLDASMYSSIQQFRLPLSQKHGSGRIKTPQTTFSFQGKTWSFGNLTTVTDLLKRCMVTGQAGDGCQLIEVEVPEEPLRELTEVTISHKAMQHVLDTLPKVPGLFQICRIREIEGNMISLTRIQESRCLDCNRVHEAENPFIYISLKGEVIFNCRRHGDHEFKGRKLFDVPVVLMDDTLSTKESEQVSEVAAVLSSSTLPVPPTMSTINNSNVQHDIPNTPSSPIYHNIVSPANVPNPGLIPGFDKRIFRTMGGLANGTMN